MIVSIPAVYSATVYTYGEKSYDGIGKFYMGREISDVIGGHGAIEWLERKERELEEKPAIVIETLNLKPTDVVADIGAGSGYFTFRLAEVVPEGKVYAVEIGSEMIEFIENKKKTLNVSNIQTIKGTIKDTRLPHESVDVILMVDAYHEFSHPKEMAKSMVKALKPNGRIFFVEYKGEDPSIPIKPLHKMTVVQVRKEMEIFALDWIQTHNPLSLQHIIEFQKK